MMRSITTPSTMTRRRLLQCLLVGLLTAVVAAAPVSKPIESERKKHAELKVLDTSLASSQSADGKGGKLTWSSKSIQYVTEDARGDITLQDLRTQLEGGDSSYAAFLAFARLDPNATCITPLSLFEETFTLLNDDIVVLGSGTAGDVMHDVLAAYLHPPSQVVLWNMVRPKPLGPIEDAPSLYCSAWLKQVYLLSRLWEKRRYYVESEEKRFRFQSRITEALQFFGWAESDSMEDVLVPLIQLQDVVDSSKSMVGRYLVSRPPPTLTRQKGLLKHLNDLSKHFGDCMHVFDIFPETFYAGNYVQCEVLKEYIDTPGSKWMRTSSTYKKGMGPIRKLTSGDCSPDGDSEVSYQRIIDTLKVDGRATSFKLYALFASFDPLVVFSNFQNGHVSILGDEDLSKWDGSCPYCRSASASSDLWSFSKLDKYMAKEHNIENFFATHVFPQYTNILSWIIQSLKSKFAGGVGHFDLVCMDFVLSEDDYKLYLLDVSSGCTAPGITDPINQRKHMWLSAMEVVLEVQRAVLSDSSVLDMVDDNLVTSNEYYKLAYSNQPGAEHGLLLQCTHDKEQDRNFSQSNKSEL